MANLLGLGTTSKGASIFRAGRRSKIANRLLRVGGRGARHVTIDMAAGPLLEELDRLVKQTTPEIGSATVRATALKLLELITLKTPVDTGLARSTWIVSGDTVRRETRARRGLEPKRLQGARRMPAKRANDAQDEVEVSHRLFPKSRDSFFIEIMNNLQYILALEFGSSAQAPLGMVRLSFAEMSGRTPKATAELFQQEWLAAMLRTGRKLRAFSRRFKKTGRIRVAGVIA